MKMPLMTERDNNSSIAQGADFAKLLVQYQPKLRTYVRAVIFQEADVDEIVQETASKAFARFDQYDPSRPFDAWLITIARFEVMTFLKSRRRDRLVFSTETVNKLLQNLEDRHDRWSRYTLDSLERCMKRLEQPDRDLIRMRYAEGKLGKQIALLLTVSEATVCRRLSRVYGQLLACIRKSVNDGGVA